ncbi:bifunctional Nucleotide cyclase/Adenylyl cyclase class-3-4-guanylyl cyclase [Babesia duncani]|uniref:Bifunctional Nucleotide cyclase/Adenylyl cyclase class-3-4-guanylyl cyclase n=1 Tax=Babesia duncani TaxID=323732 RepID=A0AAD9UMU6_9APIC|nr:bifunctional Nucleotide cyclase/Adenylyl cyclase class-3-4-guanylyl cyclase [Babesia duncani]
MLDDEHVQNTLTYLAKSCTCVRRVVDPKEQHEDDDDEYVDLDDASYQEDLIKKDWKWLSLRCERRLNEQLKFLKHENIPAKGQPLDSSEFACFVPRFMRSIILNPIQAGEIANIDAVVMFCDVSGFTALAETIEQSGDPEAAATLGRCLNNFFDPLIKIIHYWGGDIFKFSGDAVLVVWNVQNSFPNQLHGDEENPKFEKCLHACKCSLELHKALHNFPTGIQDKCFTMHIGIGFGHVSIAHVGGIADHWEYIIGGRPLQEIAIAEPLARGGETVISSSVWKILGNVISTLPTCQSEYFVLTGLNFEKTTATCTSENLDLDPKCIGALKKFMPSYIYTRLSCGYSAFNNEIRRLCTVFISVPGLDPSSPKGILIAQKLMQNCQKAAYAVEGVVNKFLVDDKGALILIFLGIPPGYHIDDPARSVFVALKVANVCRYLELDVGIGVTCGRVWCGTLGNALRKEYTALGDHVNLAARLMSRAATDPDNDIYVDLETCLACGEHLEFTELEKVKVKGKEALIRCFTPTGQVHLLEQSHHFKTPLETWEKWDVFEQICKRLSSDDFINLGGVALVNGHGGCGIDDLQRRIEHHIVNVLGWTCFSLGINKESVGISIAPDPQAAWRDLCNGLVTKWAKSNARQRLFSSHSNARLYGQSLRQISKKTVHGLVKELLDPSLHWRIGALNHLISGLETRTFDSIARRWLTIEPETDKRLDFISTLLPKGRPRFPKKSNVKKLETLSDYEITLLENDLLNEPIGPFIASMLQGYAAFEPVAILLNLCPGTSFMSNMDQQSWQIVLELANAASENRQKITENSQSKPILFLVLTSPHYCFQNQHASLVKRAKHYSAEFTARKLNVTETRDLIMHALCLNQNHTPNDVLEKITSYVHDYTSGMAKFVCLVLSDLNNQGRLEIESIIEDEMHQDSSYALKSCNLENVKPISQVLNYATGVLEMLTPDESFIAKVASVCPPIFFGKQLAEPNPRNFTRENINQIIKGLISKEVLEPVNTDSLQVIELVESKECLLGIQFKLSSIAIATAIKHRILTEELEWLQQTYCSS